VRRLRVIGIGPGGPDQLTLEAVDAIGTVDVFLAPDKGIGDLMLLRTEMIRQHARGPYRLVEVPDPQRDRSPADYEKAVDDWHAARVIAYEAALLEHVGPDETAGILVWGDPALYDSTLRIVERLQARGSLDLEYDVVPGVSSVSLLAARHRVVLHGVGEPVVLTTGRRLLETVAAGGDNLVVMLDGSLTCSHLDGAAWDIWWGANLGTSDESLQAGRLGDVLAAIEASRAEVKAVRGWVMDTYLLRRVTPVNDTANEAVDETA
jgi:precorrin-6A synthase